MLKTVPCTPKSTHNWPGFVYVTERCVKLCEGKITRKTCFSKGVRRGVSVVFALTDRKVPSSNPVAATHSLVGVCDEIS